MVIAFWNWKEEEDKEMEERIEQIVEELSQEEKVRLFYDLAVEIMSLYDYDESSDEEKGFLEEVKNVIDSMDDMDLF